AFGEEGGTSGTSEKHRFTTYERDNETSTDYATNRQYSQGSGRFNRPDPIGGSATDPQSLNRYAYSGNDPINLIDPSGLASETVWRLYRGTFLGAGGFSPGAGMMPDAETWGYRLGSLPGFGTVWGSMSELEEWRYDVLVQTGWKYDPAFPENFRSNDDEEAPETVGPTDPCSGVSFGALDYSKVSKYYKGKKGVAESGKDHIMRNHIDAVPNKSRYETDPPQGHDAMFLQVMFYNLITFVLGTRSDTFNKKNELVGITFTFHFPAIPVHPVYKTKGQGWIGRDLYGNTTLQNNLHLDADCKTVRNSYPGRP
ncbi:MAG: RHS repeat-associated core domain-containing protein, partial [Acidobacteriota bacterium]